MKLKELKELVTNCVKEENLTTSDIEEFKKIVKTQVINHKSEEKERDSDE